MTTIEKIKSYSNLEEGWNYGDGGPIDFEIIEKSIKLVERVKPLKTNSFPGPDGNVMVTVYYKEHYLELTIETDETVYFTYEINNEVVYDKVLDFNKALKKLDLFNIYVEENEKTK